MPGAGPPIVLIGEQPFQGEIVLTAVEKGEGRGHEFVAPRPEIGNAVNDRPARVRRHVAQGMRRVGFERVSRLRGEEVEWDHDTRPILPQRTITGFAYP